MWLSKSEPKDYDDEDVIKAIVIMTDGMFNKEYEIDNGDSATQAQALCDNIKAKGVRVFTVAFDAPAGVIPLMKSCATSDEHHFDAAKSSDLKKAFKNIAEDLTAIRLSN